MCPAWHNDKDWPDDECDDPAHGCHQRAAYYREQRAKDPNWQDSICGEPGKPGLPGLPADPEILEAFLFAKTSDDRPGD